MQLHHTTDARSISDAGAAYIAAGLSALPAHLSQKRPSVGLWAEYQNRIPIADEWAAWGQRSPEAVCLVCGKVSGNLEMIDFDLGGAVYAEWDEAVEARAPGLLERLPVEQTPGGGFHVVYRCADPVPGNQKLAMRRFDADGPDPIDIGGKSCKPTQARDGSWSTDVAMIETRGEGGQFLCCPSPRYELVRGSFGAVPTITAEERAILIECARELDELPEEMEQEQPVYVPAPSPGPTRSAAGAGLRPGDDFSERGNVEVLLRRHGWTLSHADASQQYWVRPGKNPRDGHSATVRGRVFCNHSSNSGLPVTGPKGSAHNGLSPFSLYAHLEHSGDVVPAARALAAQGYGTQGPIGAITVGGHAVQWDGGTHAEIGAAAVDLAMWFHVADLISRFPKKRRVILDGLLRAGETLNLIGATKVGKSWLMLGMVLCLLTDRPWLGRFGTTGPKRVLVIDNELHPEELSSRIVRVCSACGVHAADLSLTVLPLRGRLADVYMLGRHLDVMREKGLAFDVIVVDALYRALPPGVSENDNASMAAVYNQVDRFAREMDAAVILVHHASKGQQGGKSITDTGSGAGSIARATDTHLVFRPHEEEGVVVLEAAVRSFPPLEPMCATFDWPTWSLVDGYDPTRLVGARPAARCADMTPEEFVEEYVGAEPRKRSDVLKHAGAFMGDKTFLRLVREAEAAGLLHKSTRGRPASEGLWFSSAPFAEDAAS